MLVQSRLRYHGKYRLFDLMMLRGLQTKQQVPTCDDLSFGEKRPEARPETPACVPPARLCSCCCSLSLPETRDPEDGGSRHANQP